MPIVAPPLVAGAPSLPSADVAFSLDYRPTVNGSAYDPADNGGTVTRLQLFTTAARTGVAAADVGPAVKVSTGVYRFTVTPLAAGTYYAIITYTPTSSATSVLDVNDTITVYPFGGIVAGEAVSLAEVKAELNMKTTANDVELQRFINRAVAAVEKKIGPIIPVSVTEKHDGGGSTIVLDVPRAVSLTSIAYTTGATATLTDFDLDLKTGVLYADSTLGVRSSFVSGRRNVVVTYIAGFSPIPEDVRAGIAELVRYLWETQRGSNQGSRPGFSESEDVVTVPEFGLWPQRVKQYLAPYIVPVIA